VDKSDHWAKDRQATILEAFTVSDLQPVATSLPQLRMPVNGVCSKKKIKARVESGHKGFIDVREIHGGRNGLIFLRTQYTVRQGGQGRIVYGSDGPVKIWVNGVEAACQPQATNPCIPGQYQAKARWKKGENDIVFALASNEGNAWGLFVGAAGKK
jgi:hypothetical protein